MFPFQRKREIQMKNFWLNNTSSVFAAVLLLVSFCCSLSSAAAAVSNLKYDRACPSVLALIVHTISPEYLPKCAYIKHARLNEYLYVASNDVAADPNGSRLFTWKRKSDGSAEEWGDIWGEEYRYQGVWTLLKQSTCDSCYTVRSVYNPAIVYFVNVETNPYSSLCHRIKIDFDGQQYQYIYPSPDSDAENQKSVFSPLEDLRITMQLGNQSQQYVISPVPDVNKEHRRNVLAWGSKEEEKIDTLGELRDWVIEEAYCPPLRLQSPSLIGNLPRGKEDSKCVFLKNVLYNEYLYNDMLFGVSEEYPTVYQVFTWSYKGDSPRRWKSIDGNFHKYQSVFHLEKKNSTCLECWTIKSAFHEKAGFLFSAFKESFPAGLVAIFGGNAAAFPKDLGQDTWEIESVPDVSGQVIRIKNKAIGEKEVQYLFADQDTKKIKVNGIYKDYQRAVYMHSEGNAEKLDSWKRAADWKMIEVECPSYML